MTYSLYMCRLREYVKVKVKVKEIMNTDSDVCNVYTRAAKACFKQFLFIYFNYFYQKSSR